MTMPAPIVTQGKPFVLDDKAFLSINNVELNCVANKITLKPDTTIVTSTTICGAVDHPGATKWTLQVILYQSFEPNGTYDTLSAAKLAGVPVPYVLRFHDGMPAAGNPEFAGELIPQAFDIVDSEAGALVEVDFTWGCTGEPTEDIGTGPFPIGTAAAAAAGGGTFAAGRKAPTSTPADAPAA